MVVFYEPETFSPFKDSDPDADDRPVGATGVFSPHLDGQKLTFKFTDDAIIDEGTGSQWNLLGQANGGTADGSTSGADTSRRPLLVRPGSPSTPPPKPTPPPPNRDVPVRAEC